MKASRSWDEILAVPPEKLNQGRIPVRIFPAAEEMFETLARFTAAVIRSSLFIHRARIT